LRVTIAQLQRLLQDAFDGAREFRLPSSWHQDYFSVASQQIRQAGLVQRLGKLMIDAPSVTHQETCKVGGIKSFV
jgi:hypothetical protein